MFIPPVIRDPLCTCRRLRSSIGYAKGLEASYPLNIVLHDVPFLRPNCYSYTNGRSRDAPSEYRLD